MNENLRKRFSRSKTGQTLVEYALVLAFISVVAIGVLMAFGVNVKSVFTTINSQLSTASNGGSSGSGSGGGGGTGGPPPRGG